MSDLTMNILGFAAVNRDLEVEIREPITQQVVRTVKPFLDGTVRVPKIDPGAYEIAVKHPNLTLPVLRRPIRVLPVGDTNVTVLIDPSKFANTPIEDIPEANLAPDRGPRPLGRRDRAPALQQDAGRGDPRGRLEHAGERGARPCPEPGGNDPAGLPGGA